MVKFALAAAVIGGILFAIVPNWREVNTFIEDKLQVLGNNFKREDESTSATVSITPVESFQLKISNNASIPRRFPGVIKPKRVSDVGFNRIGALEKVLVERGDLVSRGAVLAQLDVQLLKANRRALEAQHRAAKAKLQELLAGARSQTIEAARANVAAAEADRELAETSFERMKRLIESGATSRQDFDQTQAQLTSAEESLRAAEQALDELLAGTRTEQLDAQQAMLDELVAAIEQIDVQINESKIVAPFDAIVSDRYHDEGTIVSPGVNVLRLVETGKAEVWFGLPIENGKSLQQGQAMDLSVRGIKRPATFKTLLPELDEATRTQTAIFELEHDESLPIAFGELADLQLLLPIEQDGFWLPTSSLTKGDHGLWSVFAIVGNENEKTLEKRDVEILHVDSDHVFVQGTIKAGELIVRDGVQRLTAGQRVCEITETESQ
ncbi:MAG: HlyD family efflux transporter periplasmic adaptor subunit [Pirellulaceae bacterium]